MKTKIFIYALLCVALCNITGCSEDITPPTPTNDLATVSSTQSTEGSSDYEKTTNSRGDIMDDACRLIVNGKELGDVYLKLSYEYRYAELPLTLIMEELGATVEWNDKTTATVTFDNKEYTLDATKGSLVEKGSTFNVLVAAPGSKHGVFYRVVEDEFFIDSDSAKLLLINVMRAKMSIHYDNRVVDIGNK